MGRHFVSDVTWLAVTRLPRPSSFVFLVNLVTSHVSSTSRNLSLQAHDIHLVHQKCTRQFDLFPENTLTSIPKVIRCMVMKLHTLLELPLIA